VQRATAHLKIGHKVIIGQERIETERKLNDFLDSLVRINPFRPDVKSHTAKCLVYKAESLREAMKTALRESGQTVEESRKHRDDSINMLSRVADNAGLGELVRGVEHSVFSAMDRDLCWPVVLTKGMRYDLVADLFTAGFLIALRKVEFKQKKEMYDESEARVGAWWIGAGVAAYSNGVVYAYSIGKQQKPISEIRRKSGNVKLRV
jgi:hypothetical protein